MEWKESMWNSKSFKDSKKCGSQLHSTPFLLIPLISADEDRKTYRKDWGKVFCLKQSWVIQPFDSDVLDEGQT